MKLKCPSPLCLSSGSDDGLQQQHQRKRLSGCDCLRVPDGLAKKQRSEVYGAMGTVGDVNVAKKMSAPSTRNRSVSLLKRLGNNILFNLGPGTTVGASQHQVYRAFEEDHSPPPSYWRFAGSKPPSGQTVACQDDGNDHDDTERDNDSDRRCTFSYRAVGPTSNVSGDRFFQRSFHQYVYTPQPYPGNPGKYAIERKHKVKKRDLLLVRGQHQTYQNQQLPTESKIEQKSCEPFASFCEPRTGKACQIG